MDTPALQPWPLLRSEFLGDFRVFRLRKDWRRSPRTGNEHDFIVMEAPDWVNVVALTAAREVVLVEQFRHGTASIDLEIPGGVMDPTDLDPVAAGVRELQEETGFVGENARLIGTIRPNPAIQSNRCHTVLVENCRRLANLEFDPGEDLRTRLAPAADLPQLVASGRFPHALVAVAIFHFELYQRGLKTP